MWTIPWSFDGFCGLDFFYCLTQDQRPEEFKQARKCRWSSNKCRQRFEIFKKVGEVQSSAQRPEDFRQAHAKAGGVQQRFENFNKVGGVQTKAQRPEDFRQAHAKAGGVQQRFEIFNKVGGVQTRA